MQKHQVNRSPSIHPPTNSSVEYSSMPQYCARARYNPSWLDEPPHAPLDHVHRALVPIEPVFAGRFHRHIASIIHLESPHRHPQRVASFPTHLRSRLLHMAPFCPFCAQSSVQSSASSISSGCSFMAGWLRLRWSLEKHRIPFRWKTKVEGY